MCSTWPNIPVCNLTRTFILKKTSSFHLCSLLLRFNHKNTNNWEKLCNWLLTRIITCKNPHSLGRVIVTLSKRKRFQTIRPKNSLKTITKTKKNSPAMNIAILSHKYKNTILLVTFTAHSRHKKFQSYNRQARPLKHKGSFNSISRWKLYRPCTKLKAMRSSVVFLSIPKLRKELSILKLTLMGIKYTDTE